MVSSMTGYGFYSMDKKNYSIEIETKALNSKFFDFNLKSNYEIQIMAKTICLIGLIISLLPEVSLLGHISGFITGCVLFLI